MNFFFLWQQNTLHKPNSLRLNWRAGWLWKSHYKWTSLARPAASRPQTSNNSPLSVYDHFTIVVSPLTKNIWCCEYKYMTAHTLKFNFLGEKALSYSRASTVSFIYILSSMYGKKLARDDTVRLTLNVLKMLYKRNTVVSWHSPCCSNKSTLANH